MIANLCMYVFIAGTRTSAMPIDGQQRNEITVRRGKKFKIFDIGNFIACSIVKITNFSSNTFGANSIRKVIQFSVSSFYSQNTFYFRCR